MSLKAAWVRVEKTPFDVVLTAYGETPKGGKVRIRSHTFKNACCLKDIDPDELDKVLSRLLSGAAKDD
jgi:hypothetical protein